MHDLDVGAYMYCSAVLAILYYIICANFDLLCFSHLLTEDRYLWISSHVWLAALTIAVFTPNMFVLLAFVTAFTIPWVTMVSLTPEY
jgi:hypothetical protein